MSQHENAIDSQTSHLQLSVSRHQSSNRVALLLAILGFVFMAGSGALFFAAAGFSEKVNSDPGVLVAAGNAGADLIRWASVIDMVGYLLLAPLVLTLHTRFRNAPHIDLYTVSGLGYIIFGAIGAIAFATAAPFLMRDYVTATDVQRTAIVTAFSVLYFVVVIGFWQTLECIPGAIWLLGIASILFRAKRRLLALIPLVLGILYALIAAVRVLGA